MRTSSAKSKGRVAQQWVRNRLREKYASDHVFCEPGHCMPKELVFEDIESRQMGGSGVDIILSPHAQRKIPFDIEVKCQESLNIWEALKQAETNTKPGRIPLLCFKRNRTEMYCTLKFDDLLRLLL